MTDENTLIGKLEKAADIDITSVLSRYPDHWTTIKVDGAGFIIVRKGAIIPVVNTHHLNHWALGQFPMPDPVPEGVRPDRSGSDEPEIEETETVKPFAKARRAIGIG